MIEDNPVVPRPPGFKEKSFVDLKEETHFNVSILPVFVRRKAQEYLP